MRRYQRGLAIGGGAGGVAVPQSYLYRALFNTPTSAPITTPHVFIPGPNGFVITGTDQSISGGRVICPNNVAAQGFSLSNSLALSAGRAHIWRYVRFTQTPSATGGTIGLGGSQAIGLNCRAGYYFNNTGLFTNFNNQGGVIIAALPTNNLDYDYAVIDRYLFGSLAGSYGLYRLSNSPTWTLLYVDDTTTTTPLWPQMRYTGGSLQFGEWCGFDAWGLTPLYTAVSGTIGTVTLNTADFVAKLICTGTGTQSLIFRKQDANNYWRVQRAATTLSLIQTIAGVDQAAAVSGTITATANERICVMCEGQTIYIFRYLSTGGTQLVRSVTNASGFVSATGIAISDEAAYSNLEVYPRSVYGLAA